MNTHPIFVESAFDEADYVSLLPDVDRLVRRPTGAGPEWQTRKMRDALQVLRKCCELWEEADQCGTFAVRDKMQGVILHAHDAFVRFQVQLATNANAWDSTTPKGGKIGSKTTGRNGSD